MDGNDHEDALFSTPELAAYLKVAPGTIRNWVSRGEIPYLKIGHAVRFRRSEIDAWAESHRHAAEAPEQSESGPAADAA